MAPASEPRLKAARVVQETKLKEQLHEQEELGEDIQDPDNEDTIPSIVPDRAAELTQNRRFSKLTGKFGVSKLTSKQGKENWFGIR